MEHVDRTRQISEALPKLNCGLCGYDNCGEFARAVAQGRASPFGCKQDPLSGYKISRIMGVKAPAHHYSLPPVSASRPGGSPSPRELRTEISGLARRVDGVLARIEDLKAR
ncbi:MAG: (Fe-S)-binding protein [Dehalococcoidia bacterium]